MHEIAVPVSILIKEIKGAVEGAFGFVAVIGELTNLSKSYSGHTYFTLKDGDSQIKCAFFKNQQKLNRTELKEDESFIVYGRVSVYEPRSEITLIVNLLIPYGEGVAAMQLKMLKEKLSKEGVFDSSHKLELPPFPEVIGVVTSEGGAAIHDIVNVSRKRFPPARIILSPATVQGRDADKSIVTALKKLMAIKEIDVIIIGRGGGLKEDMNPFNSELLAYTVIKSEKPVVSAVGHETDTTILDLAASFSVPTPTAAAELIFPDKNEILNSVKSDLDTIFNHLKSRTERMAMYLDNLVLSLISPSQLISDYYHLCEKLILKGERLITENIFNQLHSLSRIEAELAKNDPLQPMKKGFALIRQNNLTVKKIVELKKGEPFSVTFIDGKAEIKKWDTAK